METIQSIMAFFQSNLVASIAGFLFLAIEYWLGKTDLVKPGSTVEVILSSLAKVLEFLKLKPKPDAE